MTEAEWLAATDPWPMLDFLWVKEASDRKLRLFEAACCRRIWHLLPDERSRRAVEAAESFADASTTDEELQAAANAACAVWDADTELLATEGKWDRVSLAPPYTASAAAYNVALPLGWWGGAPAFVAPHRIVPEVTADSSTERAAHCTLLRDIFGNPFRPVAADPSWFTAAVTLAGTMYAERAFGRLPILADALEDAGCPNAELLAHLRGPGPHVRGCWALDLVLGKE
jgi:hypothetical protein